MFESNCFKESKTWVAKSCRQDPNVCIAFWTPNDFPFFMMKQFPKITCSLDSFLFTFFVTLFRYFSMIPGHYALHLRCAGNYRCAQRTGSCVSDDGSSPIGPTPFNLIDFSGAPSSAFPWHHFCDATLICSFFCAVYENHPCLDPDYIIAYL